MQFTLDFEQAKKNRDLGIERAVDHADRESPGWRERATEACLNWIADQQKGRRFLVEEIREYLYQSKQIEKAPSDRAWGAIALKILKSGLVKKIGTGQVLNPRAHRCFASMYEKI